jgi:hypothetical protein
MGKIRNAHKILVRTLKGRDHLEDLCIDGRIILVWILEKWDVRMRTGFI